MSQVMNNLQFGCVSQEKGSCVYIEDDPVTLSAE